MDGSCHLPEKRWKSAPAKRVDILNVSLTCTQSQTISTREQQARPSGQMVFIAGMARRVGGLLFLEGPKMLKVETLVISLRLRHSNPCYIALQHISF
jgi:hypothetical protein